MSVQLSLGHPDCGSQTDPKAGGHFEFSTKVLFFQGVGVAGKLQWEGTWGRWLCEQRQKQTHPGLGKGASASSAPVLPGTRGLWPHCQCTPRFCFPHHLFDLSLPASAAAGSENRYQSLHATVLGPGLHSGRGSCQTHEGLVGGRLAVRRMLPTQESIGLSSGKRFHTDPWRLHRAPWPEVQQGLRPGRVSRAAAAPAQALAPLGREGQPVSRVGITTHLLLILSYPSHILTF